MAIELAFLISFIGVTIFMIILHFLISYNVHKDMVKDLTSYHKGSFNEFKREFNKRDWEYHKGFDDSLFEVRKTPFSNYSKIHASIIEFDEEGLILSNLLDFYKFLRFKRDIKNKKIILGIEERFIHNREEEINKLL